RLFCARRLGTVCDTRWESGTSNRLFGWVVSDTLAGVRHLDVGCLEVCCLEVGCRRCLTPVGCQTPWMAGGAAARALCLLSGGRVVGVSKPGAFGAPGFFVRGGWVRCVIPGGSLAPAIRFSAGWWLTAWRGSDAWTWAAWKWAAAGV